jgi:CYTH domain-containing protein
VSQPAKYARIERERRFLLRAVPALPDLDADVARIDDLYLEGTSLRLRQATAPSGAVLQQKLGQKRAVAGGDAMQRWMTTLYLTPAEYALLAALPGRHLAKRRHRVTVAGRRLGIDVFLGALAGLVLAEVEAASDAELRAVPTPPFAHCEVTALSLFTGGALAAADPAEVLAEARRLLAR